MPRAIHMPSMAPGARRDYVENLFTYFRHANRPTLEQIAERLRNRQDLAGTVSKETLRKTLRGQTVPQRWENAQALFVVLCELAKIELDEAMGVDPWGGPTHEEHYRQRVA